MNNKLLAVKENKNVSLYSITYDYYSLSEYIRQIEEKYSYIETSLIETTIFDGVALSMGEYDYKKQECRVKKDYKIIQELEVISEHEKRCIVKIEVEYFSQIAKVLRDAFLDNMPLLNATSLIFLMRTIYGLENSFSYNSLIDKDYFSWDDPRRLSDVKFELAKINKSLNSKKIRFNKIENDNPFEIVSSIVENLQSYIIIEQVGLFPIEEKMPDFNELLAAFAIRNEDSDLFFGSLENVDINFNGFDLVNMRREEIINSYNLKKEIDEPQKQKNRMDVFNKFLQF